MISQLISINEVDINIAFWTYLQTFHNF